MPFKRGQSGNPAGRPVGSRNKRTIVAEKLFVQANAYRGSGPSTFSCGRYGNVVASRGSVVEVFQHQRTSGRVTVSAMVPPCAALAMNSMRPFGRISRMTVGPEAPFGGLHRGGANVLWADGSVRWQSDNIRPNLFRTHVLITSETDKVLGGVP